MRFGGWWWSFLWVLDDDCNAKNQKLGISGIDTAIATGFIRDRMSDRTIAEPQLSHQILFIHIVRQKSS